MIKNLRVFFVKSIIEILEEITFNRQLIKFYKSKFEKNALQTVIDVGANTGQSINLFLKLQQDCRIYALEPNPKLFNFLESKYRKKNNVSIFQAGASSITGERVFYENLLHSTSTFEELNFNSEHLKKKAQILGVEKHALITESYPVKIITLSKFIKKQNLTSIDILKIDVEGHEYECVKGLFENSPNIPIKYIQLEIHHDDMYSNSVSVTRIVKILKDNGFELEGKIPHSFGNFSEFIFVAK